MKEFAQFCHGIMFAAFVALKLLGYAWSWWWLLFPAPPVIVELIKHFGTR